MDDVMPYVLSGSFNHGLNDWLCQTRLLFQEELCRLPASCLPWISCSSCISVKCSGKPTVTRSPVLLFVLPGVGHYGTLPSIKTMGNISQHAVAHSIPTSPSHGSLALYSTFSPSRQQVAQNHSSSHSEVSSPILRGDVTLDRRHRTHLAKVTVMAQEFHLNIKLSSCRTFNTKQRYTKIQCSGVWLLNCSRGYLV